MLRLIALVAASLGLWLAAAPPPAALAEGKAAPSKGSKDKEAAPPLPGRTLDFPYDAKDVGDRSRAYTGRVFVHDRAAGAAKPLPLVVFFHGLNRDLIPHRWMGGGNEGDVRRIVADLVDRGAIPPVLLAGPGSVQKDAVSYGASFPVFDLDRFVAQVEERLDGVAKVDRERIVVTGHSGAGCSEKGGIVSATTSRVRPLAIVSIDTCMGVSLAERLAKAHPSTHVVVTWQTVSWNRGFDRFRAVFDRETKAHPPDAGVTRALDALPALPRAHDATVKQTFDKWLPTLLGAPSP